MSVMVKGNSDVFEYISQTPFHRCTIGQQGVRSSGLLHGHLIKQK